MSHRLTVSGSVLLAIGLLAGIAPLTLGTAADAVIHAAARAETTQISLRNETDNRQPEKVVEWVVGRYALAGLQPPEAEVRFHPFDPSLEECAGFAGYYTFTGLEHRIDICGIGERSRRRILLHELAHAWTYENLSESRRETFLAARELDVWNDPSVAWEERGVEHAAEIMAWGLDLRCDARDVIRDEDPDPLAAAMAHLTGASPVCQPRH